MAESLKKHFGIKIPQTIASMVGEVYPFFDGERFVAEVKKGYQPLELMARGWQIAHHLRRHLPDDYSQAIEILIASLGPRLERTEGLGLAPFLYLPHVLLVAEYGLGHFEASMRAQYQLTQRFSAEFSIRRYLEHHPVATLHVLRQWATDPSPHVRRLVSEGTRPRLPWASRLAMFQRDPQPVLALLELLKDDPELYVRRSVANNLNDIGKDHRELLVATARRWMKDASAERQWIIRHALRSAVKQGDRGALAVLGFGAAAGARLRDVAIAPQQVRRGGSVQIGFEVYNASDQIMPLLVDFRIHFVKARGASRPKVFKLKSINLGPGQAVRLGKRVSLAEMTTRRHYPGVHAVDVLLNGKPHKLGSFTVLQTK
ncbi:MAG: DNA alkylation repair protein [Gammaproteobacteria bacterium]|nr:DNA alkylation repair protein [Gammaproteobacteria bacterium]